MPLVAAVAFPVFIFLLPLLMFLLLVPGYLSADEAWLLRLLFPFLMPFSSVICSSWRIAWSPIGVRDISTSFSCSSQPLFSCS